MEKKLLELGAKGKQIPQSHPSAVGSPAVPPKVVSFLRRAAVKQWPEAKGRDGRAFFESKMIFCFFKDLSF